MLTLSPHYKINQIQTSWINLIDPVYSAISISNAPNSNKSILYPIPTPRTVKIVPQNKAIQLQYSLKPNSGTPINAGFSPKLQNPTNSIHSVWLVAERTRCNRIKCFWPGPQVRDASASVESSTPKHGEWKIIAHQKQTIDARFGVVALLRPFFLLSWLWRDWCVLMSSNCHLLETWAHPGGCYESWNLFFN